ncbi:MAG: putative bifunctional diguanylate cyclase/phosphodiesterase [Variibacter sp.]
MHPLWNYAGPTAAAPIILIVAVAVVCVVTAVYSSAHRADVVAIDQERQLFLRTINERRGQVLREAENIVTSNEAVRRMWTAFDPEWMQHRVGLRLRTFFGHDYVFVLDPKDRFVYALRGLDSVPPREFGKDLDALQTVVNDVRGHHRAGASVEIQSADEKTGVARPTRTARVQKFMGRPAVVAALGVVPNDDKIQLPPGPSPILITVSLINGPFLDDLSERLKLPVLRLVDAAHPALPAERTIDLRDDEGKEVAKFAWTPNWPGSQIVEKVVPFVGVAVAGFLLLAGFVLRYIRRATATIAAGEARLRQLAMQDPLSGLPNRSLFGERLEALIREVRQGGASAAVLSIDLDHFKDVNDTLGHHVGDALIGAVAQRLCRALRSDDLVARLGGDEFAVLTTATTDLERLGGMAQRMITTLSAPYIIGTNTLVIGASIGVVVIDRTTHDAPDVMRYADMALYRAKNEGRNRACIYDAAMNADLTQRKQLENDLRQAIKNGHLALAYQPLVSADGQRVVGVEALCRWPHKERGQVPPAQFIPIAERSELIVPLGEWVLRQACLQALQWPQVILAVNVSAIQFRRPNFVETVERILADTGFDPSRLELEITESTLIGNVDGAENAMRRLKGLGVKLALDDFGTGYSSLLYLRSFPFDKLKIDRSFVSSIEKAADAASIVHAIVSLGRGLGMKVTAEGVENADQQLFLRAAGVHSMQGFYFGRPATADEITQRLEQQASQAQSHRPRLLAVNG